VSAIVLKLGGEVVQGPHMAAIAEDVGEMLAAGQAVIVVHGGGPQATDLQKRLGLEPRVIAGRRVTDQATLDVMKLTVAGQVNVDLCALLVAAGVRPVGLHGASGPAIRAQRRPPRVISGGPTEPVDLGLVGDVVDFDLALLARLAEAGYVPVLACIGCDSNDGSIFNINADVVATQLAIALPADKLVAVTGAPGVLADPDDPSTRIHRLDEADARRAIADGRVRGGMIPKLEEAFGALARGVGEVHILGGLGTGDLVRAVMQPGSVGTVLVP